MTAMISDGSIGAHGEMTLRERSAGGEVMRGREAEQKMIGDMLRCVQQGVGRVVLVDGEPGIGKSLLLREATNEAAEQGFSLAAGAAARRSRCDRIWVIHHAVVSGKSRPGSSAVSPANGSRRAARSTKNGIASPS